MNKQEFLHQFREPRITLGAFNDELFISKNDLDIIERNIEVSEIKNYYTPWYYIDNGEVDYGKACIDERARAMKISEIKSKSKDSGRNYVIEKYRKEIILNYFLPFIIATDTIKNKTLILDGNKTLAAIYQNNSQLNKKIKIIEIKGRNLESIIGDFKIINR